MVQNYILLLLLPFLLMADGAPQTQETGNSGATSQHHIDLMEDDQSPAAMRNRRDALCHDVQNGKQRCTSIQCDPKYGWCAHCSFDLPAEEPEKVEKPPMNCHWVRIATASATIPAAIVPSAIILLSTLSIFLSHFL